MPKKRMSNPDAVIKAVTGRRNKTTTWKHQLRDVIKAHGPEGAREQLGVSKSTWRRWNTGQGGPSKANLGKIAGEWDTRPVRAASLPPRRARKAAANGFSVHVHGLVGPTSDPYYARVRTIKTTLSPEAAARIMSAYVDRGAAAAEDELREALALEHFSANNAVHDDATLTDLQTVDFKAREPHAGNAFDQFNE